MGDLCSKNMANFIKLKTFIFLKSVYFLTVIFKESKRVVGWNFCQDESNFSCVDFLNGYLEKRTCHVMLWWFKLLENQSYQVGILIVMYFRLGSSRSTENSDFNLFGSYSKQHCLIFFYLWHTHLRETV